MATRRRLFSLLPAVAVAALLPGHLTRAVAVQDAPKVIVAENSFSGVVDTSQLVVDVTSDLCAVWNDVFNLAYIRGYTANGFRTASEPARLGATFAESMRRGSSDVRAASEEMTVALKMAQGAVR